MMKNLFFLLLIFLCALQTGFSQSFVDNALLFSRTRASGSARIQGLGGAQTALGGDYSAGVSNPAGLGMFNASEFTISSGLYTMKSMSSYQNVDDKGTRSVFNIPGFSLNFNSQNNRDKGFLGGSFNVSLNRTNDLNSVLQYNGQSVSSIIDYYIDVASGTGYNNLNYDLPVGLAYDNYLIQDSAYYKESLSLPIQAGDDAEYFSVLGTRPWVSDDVRFSHRKENSRVRGAQYQWAFAYGANFSDKLFVGGSLGIATIRYEYKRKYREDDIQFSLDPQHRPLDNLNLEENVSIRGSGVNLTVGAIYRPVDFLQLGASIITPTAYQLNDTYTASINTQWNNFDYPGGGTLNNVSAETREPIQSTYRLTTPMKVNAGATIFLSKYGFITADAEFVNYAKAKYKSDDIDFSTDNKIIKSTYQDVINYRVGAEFRLDIYRIRAGYGMQSNAYQGATNISRSIQTLSGGFGVRLDDFYIDFALVRNQWDTTYSPYVFSDGAGPIVELKNTSTTGTITLGFTY